MYSESLHLRARQVINEFILDSIQRKHLKEKGFNFIQI